MNKKLLLLAAAWFAVIGYTFADTVATSGATASATSTGASATVSSTWADTTGSDEATDAELNSLLGGDSSASDTAVKTTSTSTWSSNSISWGYADSDMISATADATSITLKSPIVKDSAGKQILTYVVKYSTKSMSEKIDSLEWATAPQEKVFTFVLSGGVLVSSDSTGANLSGSTVDLTMNIPGLTAGTYYVIVTPKNADNVEWTPSKEVSVMLGNAWADHSSAWSAAGMNADITVTGGMANVTWAQVTWATKMQVFAKFAWDADYKKIAEEDVTKGAYSFKLQSKKDFLVKLVAIDGAGAQVWPEQILTGKGDVDIKAPKVWPASTMIIGMLLLSIVWYVTYRFRKIRN